MTVENLIKVLHTHHKDALVYTYEDGTLVLHHSDYPDGVYINF